MTNFLRCLGAVWLAPATVILWLFYLLPFWALGLIRYDGSPRFLVARFIVTDKSEWLRAKWEGWGGHAMPHAIVLKENNVAIEVHELRHTDQWLWFGLLFPIIYGLLLIPFGYYNNPLERDARCWARYNGAHWGL